MVKKPIKATTSLELDPVVSAAWLYYHLDLTQAEVATALGVSRTTVVNFLAEARERGIVTIQVEPEYLASLNLAQSVRERFGLKDAFVVPTPIPATVEQVGSGLGQASALYLERILRPGETLAVGWGQTLLEVAKALRAKPQADMKVAQLMGGLSSGAALNPSTVAAILAEKLQARHHYIYMPAVVASVEVRQILLSDPSLYAGLEVAKTADRALVGIGEVSQEATVVKTGFISSLQIDELRAKGAVGEMMSRYFDIHGRPVRSSFDDRLTGLSFEELAKLKNVIAVVGGQRKAEAVLGLLRSGLVHVLISDRETIERVVELEQTI